MSPQSRIDDLRRTLQKAGNRFAARPIREAMEHRELGIPLARTLLADAVRLLDRGRPVSPGPTRAAVYLAAWHGDPESLPAVRRLFEERAAAQAVLGDMISEHVGGILWHLVVGTETPLAPLAALLASPSVHPWVLDGVAQAMNIGVEVERLSRLEVEAALQTRLRQQIERGAGGQDDPAQADGHIINAALSWSLLMCDPDPEEGGETVALLDALEEQALIDPDMNGPEWREWAGQVELAADRLALDPVNPYEVLGFLHGSSGLGGSRSGGGKSRKHGKRGTGKRSKARRGRR